MAKSIVLAAGGTGGHLFPAEALARELLNRGHKVAIITDKRGHAFKSLADDVGIFCVRAATFKPGLSAKVKAIIDICRGIVQSVFLLLKLKPDVIVGFGGYPSFPPLLAGQILCKTTVLHEQNAVLGKANIILACGATKIATALPDTRGIKDKDRKKTVVTGNPVRAAICAVRDMPYKAPTLAEDFILFITGGSQAAKAFSDIVPQAAALLPETLKKRLVAVHQCREEDIEKTKNAYAAAGVRSEVKSFFSDMPERLAACHLFFGRSGASTVAEIAVVGRPAIFVPLLHADRQQVYNAEMLVNKGGAWLFMQDSLTSQTLAEKLRELMEHPALLEKAAAVARACGEPDAAKKMADAVESL